MATKTKSSVKVRPLGDRIIVRRDVAMDRTESGIYLPEQAKDTPKTGVILAVGDGALNTETGDRIVISDLTAPVPGMDLTTGDEDEDGKRPVEQEEMEET